MVQADLILRTHWRWVVAVTFGTGILGSELYRAMSWQEAEPEFEPSSTYI